MFLPKVNGGLCTADTEVVYDVGPIVEDASCRVGFDVQVLCQILVLVVCEEVTSSLVIKLQPHRSIMTDSICVISKRRVLKYQPRRGCRQRAKGRTGRVMNDRRGHDLRRNEGNQLPRSPSRDLPTIRTITRNSGVKWRLSSFL